jgi:hypothetical protein
MKTGASFIEGARCAVERRRESHRRGIEYFTLDFLGNLQIEIGGEMRIRTKSYLAVIAMFGLSLPLWARTNSVPLEVDHTLTIGNQQLSPGQYNLKANDGDNQLRIVRSDNGKTVATIPVQWIDLSQKARQSEVLMREDRIVQVDFDGKTKAVEVR